MRILVLGAGTVGGYFGGRLAEAGADVTFLVRPTRAGLLARQGLRIASPRGDLRLTVKCVTQEQARADYELVLFTAKAYDLDGAIEAIAPAMGRAARVLPLLNGMAHMQALDQRFGRERVLGGVAYIGATLAADGEIRHVNDVHRVLFGPRAASARPVCEALLGAFAPAKAHAELVDEIEQAMWNKWVFLAALAGMTCLMRASVGDIVATATGDKLMLAMLEQCAAVARAEGQPVAAPALQNYRAMLTQEGSPLIASMLRDLEAGGPTEGGHILGALLTLAHSHGLEAPLLEAAATHLEAYAMRRRREAAAKAG
ncbi:MAG TPA: 2-dehydropantoate 2-reductase [Burkholderiales bacterium]|nr:2-dehydropantoate 2-reductase [Burkholderiales bacterium]